MFILASASIFGWLLTFHGFGRILVDFLQGLGLPSTAMLFALVVMLLIIGLFIEGLAALIIFVPVFMPLIPVFGFDPIQFAMIIIVTILIGTVTPPVGLLILMVLFAPLTTYLPHLFGLA